MDYTIKDAVETLGMTVHTIRHYCDMGLVPNLRLNEHGHRIFNEESFKWLKAAASLRSYDMPIPEIRHYFALCQKGNETFEQRYQMLMDLKAKRAQKIKDLQDSMVAFEEESVESRKLFDGSGVDDCNPLNWE